MQECVHDARKWPPQRLRVPRVGQPHDARALRDWEVTQIENINILESNHAAAVSDDIGASDVTGEWFFMGDDAVTLALVRDPELRMGRPLEDDLNRQRMLGWVGTLEAGLPWDLASHSRVIFGTST